MKTCVSKEQLEAYNTVKGYVGPSVEAGTIDTAEDSLELWMLAKNIDNHRGSSIADDGEVLKGDIIEVEAVKIDTLTGTNGGTFKRTLGRWTVAKAKGGSFQREGWFKTPIGKAAVFKAFQSRNGKYKNY